MSYLTVNHVGQSNNTDLNQGSVNISKAEYRLEAIRNDFQPTESSLANALRDPSLNQAEKDYIVETLAKSHRGDLQIFYGRESLREQNDVNGKLSQDRKIIGQALQKAYKEDRISADDLLRISDASPEKNGAQRMIFMLTEGGGADLNGSVEGLSDALWHRNANNGLDRASAALGYLSSAELTPRNLNTREKRIEAFEALVDFYDFGVKTPDSAGKFWRQSALAATSRLFVADSHELLEHYTEFENYDDNKPHPLFTPARFMSQTVFNPDVHEITLDHHSDPILSVPNGFTSYISHLRNQTGKLSIKKNDQLTTMRRLGYLTAITDGGMFIALKKYDKKIYEHNNDRKNFASNVGLILGAISGKKLSSKVHQKIGEEVYDIFFKKPKKPEDELGNFFRGHSYKQANNFALEINPENSEDLRGRFESAFSAGRRGMENNIHVYVRDYEN